ncbi:carbohydrate ABC transporter permease [Paenarthrobacter aurescens]|uniref:ABC transporter permease n=1 Tax=Paenarthrobacter aurescens TaxID=43663 RepID=A0A4Y3NFB9_PAEAU|nr:sugar ABC transporter permease [Paenarthrobacter aurescens]UKA50211.1 sugar ABC transporter permease [Arthrobacter sp. FW305-123]MDO6141943.1 sugar ABC transporter permease [Paenarthrobacter aurescens]MDO6145748.1 sugar ABC transporter permease [Paenarthrobacter aurescens]MDO6156992.1 sugar ABC transporter permease [Paenarthrobacter aurescens]MDO6160978.1 sugar ABC transporter permease [Paenarthrobacter aurescens]
MTVLTKQPRGAAPASASPGGAPRIRPSRRRKQRSGYLFLLPWFLGMLFTVIPFFASLYLAFTDYNLFTEPNFVGLANFQAMFEDPRLIQSLKVTFIYTFVSVPISLAVALLVALVLNRGLQGLSIYRSVYYLPSLLGGSVAIVMLWRYIFGNDGIVNGFLGIFGIQGPAWVTDPQFSLSTLIVLNVWTFGSPMVIFLAGLRQVPGMYYEAASIDGASKWRQFRSITLPLISPIIFFNLIMQLIGSFQTFTQGYVMSGGTGGPADSTLFYNLYLYQKGFTEFEMGYASAMAWLLLMIIAIFTAINFIASKFWVFYDN